MHNGHFYSLSPERYRILIVELVKRKPISEAYNYANIFPEDEVCKQVIEEHDNQEQKKKLKSVLQPKVITLNWIEIYNRLFELINDKTDTATYFSGPRFIDTVRQFEPYFPNYTQYIELRNQEGKSTSRQIFYYDILLNLKELSRQKVINRILEIAKPFQGEKVQNILDLLDNKVIKKNNIISKDNLLEGRDKPKVFISYSWDDEPHKQWVLDLANKLCTDGIDVILDRYYLKPGRNLPHFVENSISTSDRIIIVFTPNYKLKADKRAGGVGYEYSIMNADLYNNQTTNEKIIPVLKVGSKEESIPTFMQQFIHIDLRNEANYNNSYTDLIREIYNEPAIRKPKIGIKPIFPTTT